MGSSDFWFYLAMTGWAVSLVAALFATIAAAGRRQAARAVGLLTGGVCWAVFGAGFALVLAMVGGGHGNMGPDPATLSFVLGALLHLWVSVFVGWASVANLMALPPFGESAVRLPARQRTSEWER